MPINSAFCDKCNKEIVEGETYISISRNVEQLKHNLVANTAEVMIFDSLLLCTLCYSCGNNFNYDALQKIIETIPTKNSSAYN